MGIFALMVREGVVMRIREMVRKQMRRIRRGLYDVELVFAVGLVGAQLFAWLIYALFRIAGWAVEQGIEDAWQRARPHVETLLDRIDILRRPVRGFAVWPPV